MVAHPGRASDLGSGLPAQLPRASRRQDMGPNRFGSAWHLSSCVSVNPYPSAEWPEGSDRVERCVSVNPYPSAEWPKARTVSSYVSTYCCRDSVTFSTPKMGTEGWDAQRTGYPFGPASEMPHLSGVLLLRPLIDQRSPTVPPSCPTLSSLPSFPSFPCSPSLRCRGPVPEPSHDRVRQGSSGFVRVRRRGSKYPRAVRGSGELRSPCSQRGRVLR